MPDPSQARPMFDLLEQERRAIMSGDFPALAEIATRKEQMTHAMGHVALDATTVRRLHRASQRNQTLLQAVMNGIARVKDRLASVRDVQRGLSTYDQDGLRAHRETTQPKLSKSY